MKKLVALRGKGGTGKTSILAAFFRVPGMVYVNMFDLNPDQGRATEEFARERQIRVMGRIPVDPVFSRTMVQGKTIFEYDGHSGGARGVKKIWEDLAQGP
jgi:MinD superfamily P-loop ATPase